jgi:tetratricopeptide (TPR) repeat protein
VRTRAAAAVVTTTLSVACGWLSSGSPPPAEDQAAMRAVPLPSPAGMHESVAEQLHERYAAVERERARRPRDAREFARAYGELGKVLLGARYLDAAEPALMNAAALDATDRRWPYYLAHVYRSRGNVRHAATQFERVLRLAPDDVATIVWLADTYLADGRADSAQPLVERALKADPGSAAALYQAGRLALRRGDYKEAVRQFEAALAADATAVAAHYPLGMAYRGLGDTARAQQHLAQRGRDNAIVTPVDPLMREVEQSVAGPLALEVRGVEALNRGDWPAAIEAFREGTALAPRSAALHHRLGTALAMTGRMDEARREFEVAVASSPRYARAHYSLGLLLEDRGDDEAALARYVAAVEQAPEYVQARLRMADVLRRLRRLDEALAEYERVMQADPTLADAPLGRAITLARIGRYADARDQLTDAIKAHPDHTGLPHALARLLAAAPDDRVRDGQRALKLIDEVLKKDQSTVVGETFAMALAEVGRFEAALDVQRSLITAARQAKAPALERRLQENLRLYEAGQPSRTVWRDEDVGDAR